MPNIKDTVDAVIKANGNKAITGPVLNAVLKAVIDAVSPFKLMTDSNGILSDVKLGDNIVARIASLDGGFTLYNEKGFTKLYADTVVTMEEGNELSPSTEYELQFKFDY